MYQQAEPSLWTGRLDSETDAKQFRHFQTIQFNDLRQVELASKQKGVGILGYAIDKGVELNKGRVGAKRGLMRLKSIRWLTRFESM